MALLILRRAALMLATMLVVSALIFLLLEFDVDSVAVKVLGPFSTQEQRNIWLEVNGYTDPALTRYLRWLGSILQGDFGDSLRFRRPVGEVLWPRLANTGLLAAIVLSTMALLGLSLGVLAGVHEGRLLDRVVSVTSVVTTSIPEFASAVFLSAVFVFWLGWLPGTSGMAAGFDPWQLVLPVMVLVTYGFGYIARLTRASMAEVMRSNYVRTARLKGLSHWSVVMRHALRNALIAPYTVIVLQINWLLSGVIVVEFFFAYKGFGALLLEASLFQDIYMVQACAIIAVAVAVISQAISDIGYAVLNPRIRVG
ncbi:MAG: ABC transporter permease [Rhodobacteraceae bacterium]|nr:MAG: ABC transporter permease [Paracoccaceae bacterium]